MLAYLPSTEKEGATVRLISDYKYDIQLMAESLALERYGLDFYSLGSPRQQQVFADASVAYWDRVASAADGME